MSKYSDVIASAVARSGGYLIISDIESRGIHRLYAYQYMKEVPGFRKLCKGVYYSSSTIPDFYYGACRRNHYGILSHESALFMTGLTKTDPLHVVMTFPSSYNPRHLKKSSIEPYFIDSSLHQIGKLECTSPLGHSVLSYNAERTICDLALEQYNKHRLMDEKLFAESIRLYFSDSFPHDIPKLLHYADRLHCRRAVQIYVDLFF